MNRFGLLVTAILLASVTLAQAQDKSILNTYRILPKPGKDEELKAALTAHVAKYHKGDWKWRVFQVVSGPEEGSYQLNEGPTSWTALEGRKNISDEHDRDYMTTVLPLVEKTFPASYLRYERELSTDSTAGTFKKVLLRNFYLKPGKFLQFREEISKWKKVFEKTGSRITVWSAYYSGQPRISLALRLTNGWADLDRLQADQFRMAYDQTHGSGTHARFLDVLSQCADRVVEEMLEWLPEVSSPEISPK